MCIVIALKLLIDVMLWCMDVRMTTTASCDVDDPYFPFGMLTTR